MTYANKMSATASWPIEFFGDAPEFYSKPRIILPEISDATIRSLVGDIDRQGFGVITNYLSSDTLLSGQAFVAAAVENVGGEYIAFTGKDAVAGTVFDTLSDPGVFEDLLKRVYEIGTGKTAPKQSLYQVLRCLKGQSGIPHALFFHYDTYMVTALLPISIPTAGQMGHLVMLPNGRRLRSNYLLNVLDKILLDNKLTQKLLAAALKRGWRGFRKVTMVPGNLYFFWGYRTAHGNEACDPAELRATALFHFGDPHTDSKIRNLTGKADGRAAKTA